MSRQTILDDINQKIINATEDKSVSPIIVGGVLTDMLALDGTVASATVSGIVDNTPLQELGGKDKTINSVRVGLGNNNIDTNTAIGSEVLQLNTTGTYDTGLGVAALTANTTGGSNTAIGAYSMYSNKTGSNNSGLGTSSLQNNVSGSNNVAIGDFSMTNNTTGAFNTALGSFALTLNTIGNQNVAIGASALSKNVGTAGNINGVRNVAVGTSALRDNTTGGNCAALGDAALLLSTTGTYNIGIGQQAGAAITTGSRNTIIANTGFAAAASSGITTGNDNLIVAPNNGNTTGITTGSGNVILGKVTGLPATSSNIIILSDGVGNIALRKNTNGELLAPNLTNELIVSGGDQSLITKKYLTYISTLEGITTVGNTTSKNIILRVPSDTFRDVILTNEDLTVRYDIYTTKLVGGYMYCQDTVTSKQASYGISNFQYQDGNGNQYAFNTTGENVTLEGNIQRNVANQSGYEVVSINGIKSNSLGNVILPLDPPNSVATSTVTPAWTKSQLNTTFPNAVVGFRMIVPNIAGGGRIYTKASNEGVNSVWVESPTTILA